MSVFEAVRRRAADIERELAAREPGGPLISHLPRVIEALAADREPPLVALDHASGVVRAYGALHDCVLAAVADDPALTPAGHRALAGWFAHATALAVESSTTATRARSLELFEQAPGFLAYLKAPDHRYVLANAAYQQIVGHRRLLGLTVREALPDIAGQGYYELLDNVVATGEPFVGRDVPLTLQHAPGGPATDAYIDFVYQPIRDLDGSIAGILVQGHDATDRHRVQSTREAAAAEVRAIADRYRELFDSIDEGFCLMQMIYDAGDRCIDYRFIQTNATFASHTGLVGADGRSAREMVPGLDQSWFDRYGDVGRTGLPARFEQHAPAMGRWFDVYANRVGDPALRQVALVFKDVSERKSAEEERERMLEAERELRRTAELAGRLRDDFLATVSHELRTPLAAILGWVQLLRGDQLPAEKHPRALETIERNARAQAQLIEDLLDVSRILEGQLRIDVEPVDLRAVIEAAIETARPAADAKNLRLQPALASGPLVMGDAARLQQVVWNLLSNAVKFTPKGGRIQVILAFHESSAELVVVDSGQGIAPEFQPHVFERFRQADGGTTRRVGGLGLGLAIVRQLTELHGGTVAVDSEGVGRGATFTLRLPLAPMRRRGITPAAGARPIARTGAQPCPPELGGLSIVVVDDEDDSREMMSAMLTGCGAAVRTAGSADAALALIEAQAPDLLLSDIGMPDRDGYALIAAVRALPAGRGGDVPAVALTAYARSEDRTRALYAGFNNHVAKPVEPVELLAVIASLMRSRRGAAPA